MTNAELTLPFYPLGETTIGYAQGLYGTELKVFPEIMHFVLGDLSAHLDGFIDAGWPRARDRSSLIRRNPKPLALRAMAQP
jgi:hypothetical protein